MRKQIINQAVKALKDFGYPNVNQENIFTDDIYSQFFKSMLEDTKSMLIDEGRDVSVIDEILTEINNL